MVLYTIPSAGGTSILLVLDSCGLDPQMFKDLGLATKSADENAVNLDRLGMNIAV